MKHIVTKSFILIICIVLLASCAIETQDFPKVDISVQVSSYSSGMGTVSGGGTYPLNSDVTITATPNSGYRFVRWDDYNTNATRTINADYSDTYIAYFEAIQTPRVTITVNRNYSSYGTVSGSGTYDVGSTVTLTATPYSGYRFVRWNDYNTNATRTITAPSSNVTYTAYFEVSPTILIFSEGFESSHWLYNTTTYAGAWNNSYYYDYSWNRTYSHSYSGTYSIGAQGTRTTYLNNTYSELQRVLYLSSFSSATLSFGEYINTEYYYDKFYVNVIANGTTYNLYSNSGASGWTDRTLNLSPYTGQTITLVFRFVSDYSVVPSGTAGVWLDDINVYAW